MSGHYQLRNFATTSTTDESTRIQRIASVLAVNKEFVIEPRIRFKTSSSVEDGAYPLHRLANIVPVHVGETGLPEIARQTNILFLAVSNVDEYDITIGLTDRKAAARCCHFTNDWANASLQSGGAASY
jgi:hypothetical protein